MCEALGYKVKSLKRVRVMNIELGSLKSGEYREIKGEELQRLYQMCGMNI
jgi:23S rRNA pseudouridine2604 synthase